MHCAAQRSSNPSSAATPTSLGSSYHWRELQASTSLGRRPAWRSSTDLRQPLNEPNPIFRESWEPSGFDCHASSKVLAIGGI